MEKHEKSIYRAKITDGAAAVPWDELDESFSESFANKNIAVTGANGFMGSRIVKRLAGYGAKVHVIVRETSDLWRFEKELDRVDICMLEITSSEAVNACFGVIKPEYVFHMAAYGVDHRKKVYLEAANTNIIGTINVLSAAKASGCRKLINTGTSMQYGNKPGSITEDSRYEPNNIYGSTKAAATILFHQLAQENELPAATIIPFGVFGESEGSHKFFPHVILSALRGIDVELSHCEQLRDYCYVENIIDGFLLAAADDSIKNEIFNIGSGEVHKLKYFVDLITEKIDCSCNIRYGAVEYRKNDLWSPMPDISRITQLGWKPRIGLEEGIITTIQWFRKNLDKYSIKGR